MAVTVYPGAVQESARLLEARIDELERQGLSEAELDRIVRSEMGQIVRQATMNVAHHGQ